MNPYNIPPPQPVDLTALAAFNRGVDKAKRAYYDDVTFDDRLARHARDQKRYRLRKESQK